MRPSVSGRTLTSTCGRCSCCGSMLVNVLRCLYVSLRCLSGCTCGLGSSCSCLHLCLIDACVGSRCLGLLAADAASTPAHRFDMAMLIWSKFPDSPVRSALLAATLYRRWAKMPDVKPHVAASMMQSARDFEAVAVEVQLLAMKEDEMNAIETLEMTSRLWKGQTGVDLAILGECKQFIERCCVQALDYRCSPAP